jgi:hypothetical protein
MVYNIKMGIVAGAGIAGTAYSTFSSKSEGSQAQYVSCLFFLFFYGSNNGCIGTSNRGNSGGDSRLKNGSMSKNDDTFNQMHMWKY